MPSTSAKQKRFMAAAAHSKEFAKKADISQKVAREFNKADQARDHIARALVERKQRR